MPTDNTEDYLDYLDEPEACCAESDCGCGGGPIEPAAVDRFIKLEARNRKLEQAVEIMKDALGRYRMRGLLFPATNNGDAEAANSALKKIKELLDA